VPLPLANPQIPVATRPRRTSIYDAPTPLRLWHLASLDAPTVSVVWSFAFAWAAGIRLPAWISALLVLGTWAVYIGDRLLDARSALRSGTTGSLRDRHFFHWRHRHVLVSVACVAFLLATALIFTLMPLAFRERDSVLAVAALAYFSGVHLPRRPRWLAPVLTKELLVGILFAAGCALPTLTRLRTEHLASLVAAVGFFAALAWLNCLAIDRWESSPARSIRSASATILGAGLLLALFFSFAQPRIAALVLAATTSALLLALLDRHRTRLTPIALRASADMVLLTPVLLLLR
jgi:hypothetical protein